MAVLGFIFYAIVLFWSLEHTEREAQNISRTEDTIITSVPDEVFKTTTSDPPPVKHRATQPPTQPPTPQQKQQHEMQFHPRILVLNTDDSTQQAYHSVSTPHQIQHNNRARSIDFILPMSNITSSSLSQNHSATATQVNTQATASTSTLSPVQQRREQCIPQEKWQTDSFVNCNQLHELDMVSKSKDDELKFLGEGWFRAAWQFSFLEYNADSVEESALVLKTLRLEREFLDEYYELHRRDAVAMERLTWSPYVMNVYGYCGQSAMNELASFKEGISNLEQLDRVMRKMKQTKNKDKEKVNYMKLKLAASVATGLSHVHSVHRPLSPASHSTATTTIALMAHYDINPRNIAVVAGGKPKLNDFNIAEFIQYNPTTNGSCGFPSRLHEPWWRAPEEMYIPNDSEIDMRLISEKVDIYALGAVLFHILTTHSPRGKLKKERMDGVRAEVARGVAPILPAPYNTSTSTSVRAFRKAMDLCFVVDPDHRGTSHEIASILRNALNEYEKH
jgi:hypothetical protein